MDFHPTEHTLNGSWIFAYFQSQALSPVDIGTDSSEAENHIATQEDLVRGISIEDT